MYGICGVSKDKMQVGLNVVLVVTQMVLAGLQSLNIIYVISNSWQE